MRFFSKGAMFFIFLTAVCVWPARGQDRVEKLLEELTNAPGISGQESAVRQIVARELRTIGAKVSTDGLGSVIGEFAGAAGGPRIMLAAHMDEVGLMVKYIGEHGFIKFLPIGGWFDQALVDKRWVVHTDKGPVAGVTGIKTVHISSPSDRTQVFTRDELFIDVGARNKAEAQAMGIRPGQMITPDSRFARLGEGAYVAKAFDDRLGVAVMLEAVRRLSAMQRLNHIFAVGTVQEEIGLRGAQTSSQVVRPDVGISVEVGVAGDYPGVGPNEAQERLGGGPGLFLHDSSMLPNAKLRDFFFTVAKEKGIPLQPELLTGYGEDGAQMQKWSTGTPAVNFTVPVRYLHSFNGVIRREDFDRAVDLLVEVLLRLDANTVAGLKSFE
ncbi:MAG: M42 family metallopeptidase [Candidatus Acidiferrales bacterium]